MCGCAIKGNWRIFWRHRSSGKTQVEWTGKVALRKADEFLSIGKAWTDYILTHSRLSRLSIQSFVLTHTSLNRWGIQNYFLTHSRLNRWGIYTQTIFWPTPGWTDEAQKSDILTHTKLNTWTIQSCILTLQVEKIKHFSSRPWSLEVCCFSVLFLFR